MDLREALAGFAGWQGHGHGERAAAWLARLEINRPEIEAFRAAATPSSPAYAALPAQVEPASGEGAGEPALPRDAAQALERARASRSLNAFTWLPDALEAARAGLLEGVPVAIKDLMHVRGMPLSGGGKAMDVRVAARDAAVVERLRGAGAIVVGLANLHEFAYGITSDNPHFGRVVNPAARDRIPGGSSGGSAAAIAAGIVPLAVGTDTAGSIRIPAACCGVVGFKPSYDALPRDGVIDLAASLDHVGPMARSVDACAAMYAAMLGLETMPRWTRADLGGVRIARLSGYFERPLDGEVLAALDAAQAALAGDGARVAGHSIDGAEMAPAIQLQTITPEATAFHWQRLQARPQDYGEDVRVRLEMGVFFPGHWHVKAQRMRAQLVRSIESAFADADLLLCATLRTPAPRVGAARVDIGGHDFPLHTAVTNLTLPFNLSGLPAIAVPWSRSKDGVPISLQLVGPRGRDWRVLAAARRLEALSPWRREAPR